MTSSPTSNRLGSIAALCLALAALAPAAGDLENLANLHGVAGDESQVIEYVRKRLGGRGEIDNTGSLTVSFGSGSPHTLLATGVDEPGYVVSEITADGYLRLQRLAEPSPSYRFDSYFFGQPVRVSRFDAAPLPGVVAAPSVHFDSDRGGSNTRGLDQLFVDIGASSRGEVNAAGVAVLDRVSLEREALELVSGRIVAPWLESRAGAAVLLALADRFAEHRPKGRVTLAFLARRHYHNEGLIRVLRRIAPEQAVLLRPGGRDGLSLAPISEVASSLDDRLAAHSDALKIALSRDSPEKIGFGPFGAEHVWPEQADAAALLIGAENSGTPIAAVSPAILADAAALLAALVESDQADWKAAVTAEHPPAHATAKTGEPDALFDLIERLLGEPGVSGAEEAVRSAIRGLLPPWAAERSSIDEKGNLIVALGSAGAPQAVFIAHMDEIGYEVTRLASDGALALQAQGGLDPDLFAWHPLTVWGAGSALHAIMLRAGDASIGATTREVALAAGVEVGMTATPAKNLRRLLGNRISGRSLDDRVGCAALISVLRSDPGKLNSGAPIWFVFSVQEETGLHGAEFLARELTAVRRAYPVDSLVTSDSPLEPSRIGRLELGRGAALRALDSSGMTSRSEVERVLALARSEGIPVQVGVTAGGNDGARFPRVGAANVPLSFPLRYSHSSAETADLGDIRALISMIEALTLDELRSDPARVVQ